MFARSFPDRPVGETLRRWLWLVGLLLPVAASAEPDPKRSVAVLEYRSGSSQLAAAAARVATVLGEKTSLAVLDPGDAQRRYGSELARAVAECGGEAGCIATLGKELEVREILLVSVSEFGDVILTMQRIDVATGEVLARLAEAMAPGTRPGVGQYATWLARVMPRSDFVRYGSILIQANIAGATVFIGDDVRGKTPLGPLRVRAPANYDVRLDKQGYVPFRATMEVLPDAQVVLKPELEPRGAGRPAWYGRWWVWAIAGSAVLGTVAVVAVTSGPDRDVGVSVRPY